MRPYIGITGFMSVSELEQVSEGYEGKLDEDPFVMAGILISAKTLRGQPASQPNRYPEFKEANSIAFISDRRVKTYLHYNTHAKGEDLYVELLALVAGCPLVDGTQLNVFWPDVKALMMFKEVTQSKYEIIIQVGREALAKANSPDRVAALLRPYAHFEVADHVLIDASGGKGADLNVEQVRSHVRSLHDDHLNEKFGIGFAGGLSDKNLNRIVPLLEEFPDLSIDAEGKLRSDDDHLDVERAVRYANNALSVMRKAREKIA